MIDDNYWKVEVLRSTSNKGGCSTIKTLSGNTYDMLDYEMHKETDDSIIITMRILGANIQLLHINADEIESIITNR